MPLLRGSSVSLLLYLTSLIQKTRWWMYVWTGIMFEEPLQHVEQACHHHTGLSTEFQRYL